MEQKLDREHGSVFQPKYDAAGLLTGVVQDLETHQVLMVAFMNAEAVQLTRETGFAHFYSRSRKQLWKKGETSGNVLKVERIFVDCDQDALILSVTPHGPACHTGARECFYRELKNGALLKSEI